MNALLDRPPKSRTRRLKDLTNATHERLHEAIMAGAPFASRERYALFLKVQFGFHREIDALYVDPVLDRLLPDLSGRRRLGLVEQDLADLSVAPPPAEGAATFRPGGTGGRRHRVQLALCRGGLESRRGVPAEGRSGAWPQ